jgi:Taurine catabolism dioxygenase TauD, TfdA family
VELDVLRFTTSEMTSLVARWNASDSDPGLEATIGAGFLATLAEAGVGLPYTFSEQHGGRLVHDIRPHSGRELTISSQGRVPFDFHTDDAFLVAAARPERLALLGLRNPSRVPTVVVGLGDILDRLAPTTVATLQRPDYQFRCPDSFAISRHAPFSSWPRPILRRSSSFRDEIALATRIRVTASRSPDAEGHLEQLRIAIREARRTEILLAPGEILVVSNSRCVHGRGAIRGDRWLKRAYLRDDLEVLEAVASTDEPSVYSAMTAFQWGEHEHADW